MFLLSMLKTLSLIEDKKMKDYNKKILKAIDDFKNGKMVIVVDDKDRENEGDFIISAELCTAEDINFMMKEARGLICVSIKNERAKDFEKA